MILTDNNGKPRLILEDLLIQVTEPDFPEYTVGTRMVVDLLGNHGSFSTEIIVDLENTIPDLIEQLTSFANRSSQIVEWSTEMSGISLYLKWSTALRILCTVEVRIDWIDMDFHPIEQEAYSVSFFVDLAQIDRFLAALRSHMSSYAVVNRYTISAI